MSIDTMTRAQLEAHLDAERERRRWRHLPQQYREAGERVRAAYERGDHATSLRYSVWASRAMLTEHPSNRSIARKIFNGQPI